MKQSFTIKTRKQNELSTKITRLKRSVFVLLNEVERLEAFPLADVSQGINLGNELRRIEIHLIGHALEETAGNQAQAARLLGINVTTLHAKIRRYGIKPRDLSANNYHSKVPSGDHLRDENTID